MRRIETMEQVRSITEGEALPKSVTEENWTRKRGKKDKPGKGKGHTMLLFIFLFKKSLRSYMEKEGREESKIWAVIQKQRRGNWDCKYGIWLCLSIMLFCYKDGRAEKKGNQSIAKRKPGWLQSDFHRRPNSFSELRYCATWEEDWRKRMLWDSQGQVLVGEKEENLVYLKSLFRYMIRPEKTQKLEQRSGPAVFASAEQNLQGLPKNLTGCLTGLVSLSDWKTWKWLVSM